MRKIPTRVDDLACSFVDLTLLHYYTATISPKRDTSMGLGWIDVEHEPLHCVDLAVGIGFPGQREKRAKENKTKTRRAS